MISPQRLLNPKAPRQRVGELYAVLVDVVRHVLKPPHALRRIALYRCHFGQTLLLIGLQRAAEVVVLG